MNDLVSNGIPKSRSAHFAGIARSMIYYQCRKIEPQFDADLEKRISHVVEERPSYGTRRVTAMIRRSGSRVGRNRIRRHMRHMNLIATHKKVHRKHVPRTIVVARPNVMWETDFTKIYILISLLLPPRCLFKCIKYVLLLSCPFEFTQSAICILHNMQLLQFQQHFLQ